jgi:hypothetical protein
MDDFEYYDEPVDDSVWGWDLTDKPCPECGGKMKKKETEFSDLVEIEECCISCEHYEIYYE